MRSRPDRQIKALERRLILGLFKSTEPCADCGNQYPHYMMEWDHRQHRKGHVTTALGTRSNKSISKEIDQCDLVCANCHRKRTYERRQQGAGLIQRIL